MPAFDDDDPRNIPFEDVPRHDSRRRDQHGEHHDSWDLDAPARRGIAPDDLNAIRCDSCRKLILEDSLRCPYCGDLQFEQETFDRPFWLIAIVVFCAGALGGFAFLWFAGIFHWPP